MKVIYTEEEVKEIVLNHVQANVDDDINFASISSYSADFITLHDGSIEAVRAAL